MLRIPLKSIIETLGDPTDPDQMVILNGPVYFVTVRGEVNVAYDVNLNSLIGHTYSETLARVRKSQIPKVWR